MKERIAFVLSVIVLAVLHEGTHAIIAVICNEYEAFNVRPLGLEVTYKTPINERNGIQWAFMAGTSNLVTLSLGYLLLGLAKRIARSQVTFLKIVVYYLTFLALIVDPFNLSIGPFIYGGDANGIAVGLGISRYFVQFPFLLILFFNRELIAYKLLPTYGVHANHFLLRPWIRTVKRSSVEIQ